LSKGHFCIEDEKIIIETGRKASFWRVQINFIFTDNVRIFCESWMSKSPKQVSNCLKIA